MGSYTSESGQSSCTTCGFPTSTRIKGDTECLGFCICLGTANGTLLGMVIGFMFFLAILGIARNEMNFGVKDENGKTKFLSATLPFFVNMAMPIADVVTDVVYLTTEQFYSKSFFYSRA